MEFDQNKVRQVVKEDRLSSLPDDLIHQILSCFDLKFAVQTCLLSSRWKLVWTSMPCLNLSSEHFDGNLHKFGKFVTRVLSHRNHQIEVASVELFFYTSISQVIARKVANYAFSHNIQELTVILRSPRYNQRNCPPCLFSSHSQSLKHFTLCSSPFRHCVTPSTPWDFPALTTLHLSCIILCTDSTIESIDLFSKCVNLKNLTLENFSSVDGAVLDIITPRLSNLTLKRCTTRCWVLNLIAPQLEKLTVIDCWFEYFNAPSGLSSLDYSGSHSHRPLQLCKDRFPSLNKVTIFLYYDGLRYQKEDARKIISMLQELHSARYLTVDVGIVECISSFPDLLLHHSSPFSNLNCLSIDSRLRKNPNVLSFYDIVTGSACQAKMSTEAENFFLENSPNAKVIWE